MPLIRWNATLDLRLVLSRRSLAPPCPDSAYNFVSRVLRVVTLLLLRLVQVLRWLLRVCAHTV